MQIHDAVALITGGAGGIGKTCARALSRAGARIAICDMQRNEVARVVQEIRDTGGDAIGVVGDVTSEEDQARFVRQTIEAFGRLNILIPSAGIIRDGLLIKKDKQTGKIARRMSGDQWRSVIDVNLTGTFLSIREAVAAMAENQWEGIIFTISSIGKEGQTGQLNYSATKVAVAQMPKILVGEFMIQKIRNIRVVGIAPGFVGTTILKGMNQEALAAILQDVHLNRLIEPEEIAALILHCIENEAINGATLEITGGLTYRGSRAK
jgi:3-oxoacyl-[acyl-carrier protein] reductase